MAEDRGEAVSQIEPLLIPENSKHRGELVDLVIELTEKSAALRRSLPDGIVTALSDLVRSMNCYYSNLIEGHNTHPIDIEKALKNEYHDDPRKRDLQKEAQAHIAVQQWIDNGNLFKRAVTVDGLLDIHRRFCKDLPEDLLKIKIPDTAEYIELVPGELRQRDVIVGRHIPISSGALPRFSGLTHENKNIGFTC